MSIIDKDTARDNDQSSRPQENVRTMKICIIGAGESVGGLLYWRSGLTWEGMGGLTSALALAKRGFKDIEVYEYAPDLGFVGAGIQLAPNLARILDRLGVWEDIVRESVVINETSVLEGHDNRELGHQRMEGLREQYGYNHVVGHRSTLAHAIYQGCLREPSSIKFRFDTAVESVKSFGPSPKPSFVARRRGSKDPTYTVSCDILLAGDGIKSVTRVAMLDALGATANVIDTGAAAYRIMITREQMASDPELLALLDSNKVSRWVGERRHIIAYPVSSHQIYNLSSSQPDVNFADAPSAMYTTRGSKSAMLDVYKDFCPLVQKMLRLVPEGEVCEWKLRVHSPLPTWVHGSTALIGDACHPTLPHLNQGAAQAIEDAAVLAVVLGFLEDTRPESINRVLKSYESVRRERADTLVAMAAANGRAMQLGEGKAKEERDRQFQLAKEGKAAHPDRWADKEVQRMIFGHDCAKVAEDLMLGSRLRSSL
ncbi:MAG: hypothetical protein Q9162_004564 [Coniocarpon cinnabarinum]